ncbi:MAG: hypothetical protein JSV86_05425 [Gemmatimonadota bacterium]|nr:MAG: hypothetical protein JSV86_05425 [Gemmatimonadota bacterium]
MAQVWKIRLPDGRTYTPGDWTTAEPLWSTVEVAAAAVPILAAFSYGVGGDVPGSVGPREADLRDTNLEGEGGKLPENQELVIFNICVEVFKNGAGAGGDAIPQTDQPDVSILDMLRLQRDMIMRLRIADVKDYTQFPISYFPASTGVEQYNSGARSVANAARGFMAANNGGTSVGDQRVLSAPHYVAGGEAFRLDFEAGPGQVNGLDLAANETMVLRTYLDGYIRRPVA